MQRPSTIIHVGDISLKSRYLYENYTDILNNFLEIIKNCKDCVIFLTGIIDIKHIIFIKVVRFWIKNLIDCADVFVVSEGNEIFLSLCDGLDINILNNKSHSKFKGFDIYTKYTEDPEQGPYKIHINGKDHSKYDVVLRSGNKNTKEYENVFTVDNLIQQSFDDDVKRMYGILNVSSMEYKHCVMMSNFGMYKVTLNENNSIRINGKLRKNSYIKITIQEQQVNNIPLIRNKIEERTKILGIQYVINSTVANKFKYDNTEFHKWFITRLEFKTKKGNDISIDFDENCVLGIIGNNGSGKTHIIRIIKSILFNHKNIDIEYGRLFVFMNDTIIKIEHGEDMKHIYGNLFVEDSIIVSDEIRTSLYEYENLEECHLLAKWREYIPHAVSLESGDIQTAETLDELEQQFFETDVDTTIPIDDALIENIRNNTMKPDDIEFILDLVEILNDNNISTKKIREDCLAKKIRLYKQLLLRVKDNIKLTYYPDVLISNVNIMLMEYFDDVCMAIDDNMVIKFYKNNIDITHSLCSFEKIIISTVLNVCINLVKKDNKNCNIFIDCEFDVIHPNNVLVISKLISHMKSIYKNITIMTRREEVCEYCDKTLRL